MSGNETKDLYNLYNQYASSSYLYEDDKIINPLDELAYGTHLMNNINPSSSSSSSSYYNYMTRTSLSECLKKQSSSSYDTLEKALGLSPSSSSEVFSSNIDQPPAGIVNVHHQNNIFNEISTARVSVSSNSSSEADQDSGICRPEREAVVAGGGEESSKKVIGGKSKKKEEEEEEKKKKKRKEPRVAFMTKSEVDHLEDGYRWRKYGQKAVKNSPYPRSYYRCTTQRCNVKKRVERSYQDPTVVITTYEGQHNHPIPTNLRGISSASSSYYSSSSSPFISSHALFRPTTTTPTPAMMTRGFGQSQSQSQSQSGDGGGGMNVNQLSSHHHQQQQHAGFLQGSDYELLKDIFPSLHFPQP